MRSKTQNSSRVARAPEKKKSSSQLVFSSVFSITDSELPLLTEDAAAMGLSPCSTRDEEEEEEEQEGKEEEGG